MAEEIFCSTLKALANFSVEGVAAAAITYSSKELSAINKAKNKVEEVKSALEDMRSSLRSADREAVKNEEVKRWVAKVRVASFKVLDALDGHDYELLLIEQYSHRTSWVPNPIKRLRTGLSLLGTLRNTSKELDNIMPSVTKIRREYDAVVQKAIEPMLLGDSGPWTTGDPSSSEGQQNRATTANYGFGCDKDFIFLHNGVEPQDLKNLVLENPQESSSTSDSEWTIIAVWGMPGVGKTTLVRKIFDNVERNFDHAVWISVGQSYEKEKLLKRMFAEMEKRAKRTIAGNSDNAQVVNIDGQDGQLLRMVMDELNRKRCLIVFDDVWDNKFWKNIIEGRFRREHNRGSRILVTTRNQEVARSLAGDPLVKELRLIEEEDACMRLFCRTAFWNEPEEKCPDNLEGWAKRIVKKCGGLPLAIAAAGGIMRGKRRDATVWERSCRTLESDLSNDPSTNSILEHSYYDLRPHLKSCFLYCATFPKDTFRKDDMIRLWVAEGFLEETGHRGLSLEEEADECYEELIQRSLFQVVKQAELGTRTICSCTMHDLIRNMAFRLSSTLGFSRVLDGDTEVADSTVNAHRVYVLPNAMEFPKETKWASSLRSFSMFCDRDDLVAGISSLSFKLLKVLYLRSCGISSFPDVILTMYLLQLLDLSCNKIDIEEIPEEIGGLQRLQSLILFKSGSVKRLPSSVTKLQKLRHLLFVRLDGQGFEAPAGTWVSRYLQTLIHVKASDDLVRQIGSMKKLRELRIYGVDGPQAHDFLNSLNSLTELRQLHITMVEGCSLHLHTLTAPPVHLQYLALDAGLPSVPSWFQLLHELKAIQLKNSLLREDPCQILGSLPSLVVLEMDNAYNGSILTISSGSFRNLKKLYISYFRQLTSIEIRTPTLPELRTLQTGGCPLLRRPALFNIPTLEEFVYEDCHDSQVLWHRTS